MSVPIITVIVCTYNRCVSLAGTLESIAQSKIPESITWNVLVVDNNSDDRTREVVEEVSRSYPGHFHYLFEARPGKSHALNAGVRESTAEILAFTDDDVIVDPNWLASLADGLRDGNWAGIAGRVERTWSCSPPFWLSLEGRYEKLGWALVSFRLNQDAGALPPNFPPVGANMAFRREVFGKHGAFRTDLGPQGAEIGASSREKAGISEDTEFGFRLTRAGEQLRYEPSAIVYHPVPVRRLTKEYFLEWWFVRGRFGTRLSPERPAICGVPRRYIRMGRMTVLLVGRSLGWVFAVSPCRRFYYKAMVWEMVGAMIEGYKQWFKAGASVRPSDESTAKVSF